MLCGASRGLGSAIAKKFRDTGWNVIVLDLIRSKDSEVHFYQCDVSDYKNTEYCVSEITKKFGPIDALVNSIRYLGKRQETSHFIDEWRKGIDIDLHTYMNAAIVVCNYMKTINTSCSIVNISSVLSELVTLKEPVSYHASKAAINQLTRYLAVEFGQYNIRVNAILPGLISNHQSEKSSLEPSASLYSKLANHIPLRRTGDPNEVADLVLFLASSSASFITGQNIVIDGGLGIREQLGILPEMINT